MSFSNIVVLIAGLQNRKAKAKQIQRISVVCFIDLPFRYKRMPQQSMHQRRNMYGPGEWILMQMLVVLEWNSVPVS